MWLHTYYFSPVVETTSAPIPLTYSLSQNEQKHRSCAFCSAVERFIKRLKFFLQTLREIFFLKSALFWTEGYGDFRHIPKEPQTSKLSASAASSVRHLVTQKRLPSFDSRTSTRHSPESRLIMLLSRLSHVCDACKARKVKCHRMAFRGVHIRTLKDNPFL